MEEETVALCFHSLFARSLTHARTHASDADNQQQTKLLQSQKPGESPDGAYDVRVLNESFETQASFQARVSHDLLVSVLSITDINGSLSVDSRCK